MRFAFTDDQLALGDAVADLLAKECPPEAVRAAWESADGRVPGLWQHLAEMGLVGLVAPEAVGGTGMGSVELALCLSIAGRAGVPEPLADVAAVAVPVLAAHGVPAGFAGSTDELLARLCDGSATVAVGLVGAATVLHAEGAAALLLESADGLHLVDPAAVTLDAVASVDGSRRLSRVAWTPGDATRLAEDPAGAAASAHDRAAFAAAAELVGLCDRMLELTVGYVSERKQFGVPIGSFQAVKHHLADALLVAEFAKPLVWRAAVSFDAGDPDVSRHVSMAKARASTAASAVADACLQCHGAIGYTVEYDLHLYMKRAWALARRHGDARFHVRRVSGSLR